MTWVATQPELPSKMARDDLSEAAACAHFSAIAWVSGTETFECVIPKRLLDGALPLTNDKPAVTAELARRGYWRLHDNGDVELLEHQGFIQASLTRVGKKRKNDAKSQQTARDKARAEQAASATESVTDGVTESAAESVPRLPTDLTTAVRNELPEPSDEELRSQELETAGERPHDIWRIRGGAA